MAQSPALRRYNRRIIWLSLAYAIFLIAAIYGFKHRMVGGVSAYATAILPALAIIGMFVAIGRYLVEEHDEYQRMMMVRQTLWASGFALSIATLWGFLESFALVDRVDSYYVAVLWFGGLGVGAVVNRLTIGRSA